MGFAGVIISDAMVMKAIGDYYGVVAGSVQAVIAGNDIVEPLSLTDESAVIAGLREAVHDGRLPMAQLDASVRRILRLKQWLAEQRGVGVDAVGAHGALVRAAAEASVTLLDARAGALPIPAASGVGVIEFAPPIDARRRRGASCPGTPARCLPAAISRTRRASRSTPPIRLRTTSPRAFRLASEATIVIIGTRDANLFPAQRQAIDALQAANRPTIFISMRAPYDLADFPWAAARIAAYGDLPASLDVAAAICAGSADAARPLAG